MTKILTLLVLFPLIVFAQTQTENYIKTTTYKIPTAASIANPTITQASQNITYFDGLGRPIQQIAHQQSGTGKDIVTPIEYDSFSRQTKDYLPYVPNVPVSLDYKTSALTDVLNFAHYTGQNPFTEKQLESSPLNRVLKQAAPGTDWALNSGHEIKLEYQTNTTLDAVKLFAVTATWDATKGVYDIPTILIPADYQQFQLYKNITYDENTAATPSEANGSTVEFKNKEGQVVLKRTYESGVKHDTYYIYDQFGNLTFVIPPLVNATITISNTTLNDLCYQYKYDYRNRSVEKKLPGKQWEFIVYDKLDRLVATGPSFSPFNNSAAGVVGWLITKYDVFNRPVYTGWEQSTTVTSAGRLTKQNTMNGLTTIHEYKSAPATIDGVTTNYSNIVTPVSFKLLTVNYYDDYVFPTIPPVPTAVEGQNVLTTTKSLPTGSWVRAVTTTTATAGDTDATFYDAKARPIRTYLTNYLGGYTYTDTNLDFSGVPQFTKTYHKRLASNVELKTTAVFTYSPQGRLLTHTHQINSLPVQLLASNTYDELGQLISKNVGNSVSAPLQKIDYAYNIRGWMTEINKVAALQQGTDTKDLFGFKINYNTIDGDASVANKLYNGNIAEASWSTSPVIRTYGYKYDNLNRLKNATYYKMASLPYISKSYNENLSYDKNGNILYLTRNGDLDDALPPNAIDDLVYTYTPNTNKLQNVIDNTNNTSGFNDGNKSSVDYTYDANGNLKTDANKNITDIVYNHLNLPTKIIFPTGNITYIYNATGQKVQKVVTETGKTTITTDYLGGYQYNNAVLQFFPTAEGYVKNTTGVYSYVFNYTDHLGNVRLSYGLNANVLTIFEENNYYPFGFKHKGYNSNNLQAGYKYKFLGQERQDELGLNWDTFRHRNYDYAIGRFFGVDPVSEEYMSISTYQFAHNNPVWKIELEGLEGTPSNGKPDTTNHEPVKVVNKPVLGFVGGGLVETKVVQKTTTEVVKEVAKEAVETGGKVIGKVVGTVFALLTDYMSPNYGGRTSETPSKFTVDEKFSPKDYNVKEKTIEETGIKRINNKIDDLIDSSTPGKETKGRTDQFERKGGLDAANKEFDNLNPENIKEIKGGRVGTLPDGRTVIVRGGSTDGRPTLEIQKGKNKTKFRYDE